MTKSVYAEFDYAESIYGDTGQDDFDANSVVVDPVKYNALQVEWVFPAGSWSRMRVVRSASGVAVNPNEGTIVAEWPHTTAPNKFYDAYLAGGEYHYSIFVKDSGTSLWRFVGNGYGRAYDALDSGRRMLELLPGIYTSTLGEVAGDPDPDTDLAAFLNLLGYEYDRIRALTDGLNYRDPRSIPTPLMPLLLELLGQPEEPTLSGAVSQQMASRAVYIYKRKGTLPGISAFVRGLTGWAVDVTEGNNLFLDYNDSSFEEGVGNWTVNAGTLTTIVPDGSHPAYAASGFSPGWQNRRAGIGRLTLPAGGVVTLQCNGDGSIHDLIPVQVGQTYRFIARMNRDVAASATAKIMWINKNDNQVGATVSGSSTALGAAPGYTSVTVSAAAPSGAVRALLQVTISGSSGGIIWMDAFQMNSTAATLDFQDAREVIVSPSANRTNMIPNPSFEVNTADWVGGGGSTIATGTGSAYVGSKYGQVSYTPGGPAASCAIKTSLIPGVVSGRPYTVSAWIKRDSTVSTITGKIDWFDSTTGLVVGLPVIGQSFTIPNDAAWHQVFITGQYDPGFSGMLTNPADEVQVTFTGTGGTSTTASFKIDGVLLEETDVVGSFFSGDTPTDGNTADDFMWAGTANDSASYYFEDRLTKENRLRERLVEVVPAGGSYTIDYI